MTVDGPFTCRREKFLISFSRFIYQVRSLSAVEWTSFRNDHQHGMDLLFLPFVCAQEPPEFGKIMSHANPANHASHAILIFSSTPASHHDTAQQ